MTNEQKIEVSIKVILERIKQVIATRRPTCGHIDYPVGDASSSNCVLEKGHKYCHQYSYLGAVRPSLLIIALGEHEGYKPTKEDYELIEYYIGSLDR